MNNVIHQAPVITEDETWAAASIIMKAVALDSPLRESLNVIRHNGKHVGKMIKSLKTGWQCQLQRKSHLIVPEIVLCGNWLQDKGFNPGNKIHVLPFSELLIIIPQGR